MGRRHGPGHTSELAVRIRCTAPGSHLPPTLPTSPTREQHVAQELSAGLGHAFHTHPRQSLGPTCMLGMGTQDDPDPSLGLRGNVREKGVWVTLRS